MTNNGRDLAESAAKSLVIDDEAGIREGCRRALTQAGFVVDTAENLQTGRELLQEQSHDIYLFDVALPDGSGLDLIAPILKNCLNLHGYQ